MSATHSATDTAIRGGVVLLTLIAAAVHLSLLFPDPAFSFSTASDTLRCWPRCTCLSPS